MVAILLADHLGSHLLYSVDSLATFNLLFYWKTFATWYFYFCVILKDSNVQQPRQRERLVVTARDVDGKRKHLLVRAENLERLKVWKRAFETQTADCGTFMLILAQFSVSTLIILR